MYTKSDFRSKRILREIELFKEAFPNNNITYKDSKIVIFGQNIKCIVQLSHDWPFNPPLALVNYDNYAFYQPQICDWNPVMDIRTIFTDILNTIEDCSYKNLARIQDKVDKTVDPIKLDKADKVVDLITLDDINILKIKYPNIKVAYCEQNCYIISLVDLEIFISSNEINVYENENDWPKHMIPKYSNNIFDIVDEIWKTKKSNHTKDHTDYISLCKKSLNLYFDDINYNENHQTFIINSSKYLIIIGINVNSQYLSPMVMIYSKGMILGITYDFSNWLPDNLGKIIVEAIDNYEKS